jgi:hypothetical protein
MLNKANWQSVQSKTPFLCISVWREMRQPAVFFMGVFGFNADLPPAI